MIRQVAAMRREAQDDDVVSTCKFDPHFWRSMSIKTLVKTLAFQLRDEKTQ